MTKPPDRIQIRIDDQPKPTVRGLYRETTEPCPKCGAPSLWLYVSPAATILLETATIFVRSGPDIHELTGMIGHECGGQGVGLGLGEQSLFALTGPEMLELAGHCETAEHEYTPNRPDGPNAERWAHRLRRSHREMFPELYPEDADDG
ncbi:MAG: hypothetical protein V3V34_11890 [Kiloniellales bacterium]